MMGTDQLLGENKVGKVDRKSRVVVRRGTAILNSMTREVSLSRMHWRNDRKVKKE